MMFVVTKPFRPAVEVSWIYHKASESMAALRVGIPVSRSPNESYSKRISK